MAYKDHAEKFEGKKTKDILIFSLTTCFWCGKTEEYLKSLGIGFEVLVLDKLSGADQKEAIRELSKYNPGQSFPTIVVGGGEKVIIGFNEKELKKLADG